MLTRRRFLSHLAVIATLPVAGPALARSRPPDNHFRLAPLMLPMHRAGPFRAVRLVADLVLDLPTTRDVVRAVEPRLVNAILRATLDFSPVAEGRVDARAVKALKDNILRIARDMIGPQVQDVLIVSLIVG